MDLKKAVLFSEKTGHVFLATADAFGNPYIAVAGKLLLTPQGHIEIDDWFTEKTFSNIWENKNVFILVWDICSKSRIQLSGEVLDVEGSGGYINGYVPTIEDKSEYPQEERKLIVKINRITETKPSIVAV